MSPSSESSSSSSPFPCPACYPIIYRHQTHLSNSAMPIVEDVLSESSPSPVASLESLFGSYTRIPPIALIKGTRFTRTPYPLYAFLVMIFSLLSITPLFLFPKPQVKHCLIEVGAKL